MYGLVAAAGRSARMGVPKALLAFDPRTSFVRHIVQSYRQAGLDDVLVTVSPDATGARVRAHLLPDHVTVLDNAHMGQGLMGSLCTAVTHRAGPLLFCPVDAPFVDVKACQWLVHAARQGAASAQLLTGAGLGHPAMLSGPVAARAPDAMARGCTPRDLFDDQTVLVEWPDPACAQNVNAPADYIARFGRAPVVAGP